jgi:Leucine-rich repeat (LRR) protein
VPEDPVNAGETAGIRKLSTNGVMVMAVARNSNYLSASFVTAGSRADTLVKLLEPLKKQLISLKLDQSNVNDSTLTTISNLSNLRRLQLSNTMISDAGLVKLKKLKELGSLNLVGTKVTARGVAQLKDLKSLKYLYLYKTSITDQERAELKKNFPETALDFGNYSLPMLATDTTEVNINQ